MESEQKFIIPLDSQLDINSNDMLVPASAPKFSFNRQRLLGSVLQNAVRYEADGWFAGWWVHNFDLRNIGTILIDPDSLGFPSLQDVVIPGQNAKRYWIANFVDAALQFRFNLDTYARWVYGTGSVERSGDTAVIHGTTNKGATFTAVTDVYTGLLISFTPDDPAAELVATAYQSGGVYHLDVQRKVTLGADMIELRWGSNAVIDGATYEYKFDGTTHTWGDLLQVNGTTVTGLTMPEGWTLQSSQIIGEGSVDEYFEAIIEAVADYKITKELHATLVGAYDQFYDFARSTEYDTPYVDDYNTAETTGHDLTSSEAPEHLPITPLLPAPWASEVKAGWHFPIWLKIGQQYDISFEIEYYDRHVLAPTTDPDTGVVTVNSYADVSLYMLLKRKGKNASIQNQVDLDINWVVNVNGASYSDAVIPENGDPLRIQLSDKQSSKELETKWPVTFEAHNPHPDATGFPLPYNYMYGSVTCEFEIDADNALNWEKMPPPPPTWLDEDLWDDTVSKPGDWKNPIDYPVAWPAAPADWDYAIDPNTGVPANPWPPTGWQFGFVMPATQAWHSATVSYADLITAWATANPTWPTRYSGVMQWQMPQPDAPKPVWWEPEWPPNWPYGITLAPFGTLGNGWFSAGTTYAQLIAAVPYKEPAPDLATGGDQGYAWPGQMPPNPPDPLPDFPSIPSKPARPYPVDVAADGYVLITASDPATGAITFNPVPPTYWPTYVMEEVKSRGNVLSIAIGANQTTGGFQYTVLNRAVILFDDKHLFNTGDGLTFVDVIDGAFIFPICTYGYTYFDITTNDITKNTNGDAVKDAFDLAIASNTSRGIRVFRLDDDAKASTDSLLYSLATIVPYIMAITPADTGAVPVETIPFNYKLIVGYNNLLNVKFDKPMDYWWPMRNVTDLNALSNLQAQIPRDTIIAWGFYPEWIVDSYGGQNYWKQYSSFTQNTPTTHNALVSITFKYWLSGEDTSATSCTPNTVVNQAYKARYDGTTIATVNLPDKTVPWAPGLFIEALTLTYDRADNARVDIAYDVLSKAATFTFVPPVDPALVVATFTHETSPREKFELVIDIHVLRLIIAKLERAFIRNKVGLMAAVDLLSATAQRMDLTATYGYITRSGLYEDHDAVELIKAERTTKTISLYVGISNKAILEYVPLGIFWRNKQVEFVSVTLATGGKNLTFIYAGITYVLFIGDDATNRLKYTALDIRDDKLHEVASLDPAAIKMAVKQFWSNDVDVENFWWLTDEYVLALTKYELQLHKKIVRDPADPGASLDDWDGDRWEIVKRGNRGTFFNNLDIYYGASSAYKAMPALFKLQNNDTAIKLLLIQNIIDADFTVPEWQETLIPFETVMPPDAGINLSTANKCDALVPVDIQGLLSGSRISSTVTDDYKFILGFAVTRGIQQWTTIFDVTNIAAGFSVVNGYGHVSHTGDLTGGQIPLTDCSANGFVGKVFPINLFKDNTDDWKVDGADEKIFASGSSLWFVYSELQNIVSHMQYQNGAHVPIAMPLSNNYQCEHGVSAHKTTCLFDTIPRSLSITDLFLSGGGEGNPASTALSYFSAIALPSIWYMQPNLVAAAYSSQGIQQVAYVNRNALPVRAEDGSSDLDLTALRLVSEVNMSIDLGKYQSMVTILLGIVSSVGTAMSSDDLKINAGTDSNATSDTKGRRFGQYAVQAVADGIITALTTRGLVITVKTAVSEILSLSMFYAINDGAQCWAGPGFVNHNFIGQTVVQGNATARFKLDKYGVYMPLQFVSTLMMRGQQLVYSKAGELLDSIFDNPGGNAGGGLFVQIPVMWIASAIAQAIGMITKAMSYLYDYMIESIPALYATVGDVARGYYGGGVERNFVEPEATHSYGNKPMSMFWPAFGVATTNDMTVERVRGFVDWKAIEIRVSGFLNKQMMGTDNYALNTTGINNDFFNCGGGFTDFPFSTDLYLPRTSLKATAKSGNKLPEKMAFVEGIVKLFADAADVKNLQVNCCDYTFPAPPIHDYIVSETFDIGLQAANGETIAYSMADTKLLDGPASNIVELDTFFGIASSYAALEVKNVYDRDYLRPWAITPTCIALNLSGINCVQNAQAYHGFDGQFNRITSWKGGNGLDSATMVQQYAIIVNDHFKRSNIIPPSEFFGKFDGPPAMAMRTVGKDRLASQIMDLTRQKGLDIDIPGEDRDATRYAVPVHSEMLSTLPAVVRMLAPYKLFVIDGVTSLTTDMRNTQTKYKAPSSVDFNIYDVMWRANDEYASQITLEEGIVAVEEKTPTAGLTFIGATTKEAFFYSPATRMYYSFSGGGDISKKDIFNRFKDIKQGRWDFVNQEVVFKCLLTDTLLANDIDGLYVARLDERNVLGEIHAPNETIYNVRSDFKILSMAGGLVYQGPKRCVVNRFVITDDMVQMIKDNKRKWKKLDREEWRPKRDYGWQYKDWFTTAAIDAVKGWTHNPWRAATAMLGVSEETDCVFEWELTFAWTEQIDKIFEQNEFISFNVAGETIGQGGTLLSRPTHIFLYKELFKNGYYTMRYSSKNGSGNRERLYMWSDGMAALENLVLFAKEITARRTQPIATSQIDVQELHEQ